MPGGTITLAVSVRPNARHSRLLQAEDGSWRAELKAPPVDGKANAALLAFLAERLGVPNRAVSLRSGDTSRRKLVEIQPCPLDAAAIRAALASE